MRQFSTTERRKDREEFVYMYREEIAAIIKESDFKSQRARLFVKNVVRTALEYSPTTYYWDILCMLQRDYYRLFKTIK